MKTTALLPVLLMLALPALPACGVEKGEIVEVRRSALTAGTSAALPKYSATSDSLDSKINVTAERVDAFRTGVLVDLSALPGGGATEVSLPLGHVDPGGDGHGFVVAAGKSLVMSFQCNFRDVILHASFAGASTFHASITKDGETKELAGIEGELRLEGFETPHPDEEEIVTVRLVHGLVRKDAFSVVIDHEGQHIVLTPEGGGAGGQAKQLDHVTVEPSGLDAFAIIDPEIIGPEIGPEIIGPE